MSPACNAPKTRVEVIHVSRTSGSSGQLDAQSDDRAESTQLGLHWQELQECASSTDAPGLAN